MKPLISVMSPIYKAEKIVPELVKRISENVSKITELYEIILVCDGSPDQSWFEIVKCCKSDTRVKGINLSRNFGQHSAITAGLKYAKGDWVIVMDCDLQDNPDEISRLYQKAQEGYDIVYARRKVRHDSSLKRFSSWLFHKVYNYLSGLQTDSAIANYGIYSSQVICEYNKMGEVARSFPSLVAYLGFRSCAIDVAHSSRYEGKTSYTLHRLLKLSFDIIISNSNKPLQLSVGLGLIVTLVAIVLVIYNFIKYCLGSVLPGFSSTIISIWFIGGLNLFVLGVVGLYIDKIFNQVKQRPIYVISEILNENM